MNDSPLKKLSKKTYFIGSGKGGVGKSTLSVNLAVALSQMGYSVGLFDADVYGPSIPIMFGLRRMTPRVEVHPDGKETVIPFHKFGVKTASIGYFMEEARSVVWRGPALHSTLQKMLQDIEWGDLDYLLIDLPPGTGDVPLSLSRLLKIDGAIVVTTPQEVAILDAIKAINSFYQLEIPLMGIIENMAGFKTPDSNDVHHIFGQGKGRGLATRFDTNSFGSIPILPAVRQGCDEGYPAAFHQGNENCGEIFRDVAKQLLLVEQKTEKSNL